MRGETSAVGGETSAPMRVSRAPATGEPRRTQTSGFANAQRERSPLCRETLKSAGCLTS